MSAPTEQTPSWASQPIALPAGAKSHQWLTYYVVDVFTDRPFAGNQLAVVLDADDLSGAQMQSLAAEFALSETAFVLAPTAEELTSGAHYRIRIFTPHVELPFAGHPSIGTAWLLCSLGRLGGGRVNQACGVGVLPIDVAGEAATLTGGAPQLSEVVSARDGLAAVGLRESDLSGPAPRVAGCGIGYLVLSVAAAALSRCQPDLSVLRSVFSHPYPATGVYVVSLDAPTQVRARMFAGDLGSAEDAATGSAALALAVFLGGSGALKSSSSVVVTQGVEMGRPSELVVSCEIVEGQVVAARVQGRTAFVASGYVRVPQPVS